MNWTDLNPRLRQNLVELSRKDAQTLRESNSAGPYDPEVAEMANAYDALADAIEQEELGGVPCEVPIAVIEVRQRSATTRGARAPFRAAYTALSNRWSWRRLVADGATEEEAVANIMQRVAAQRSK